MKTTTRKKKTPGKQLDPLRPEVRKLLRGSCKQAREMIGSMSPRARIGAWLSLAKHCVQQVRGTEAMAELGARLFGGPDMKKALAMRVSEFQAFAALAMIQAAGLLDEIEAAEKKK